MQHDFWKSTTSYSFHLLFSNHKKYSLDTPISLPHERVKITSVQTLQNKNFLKFIKNILK